MRNRSALVLVAAMVSVLALAFAPTQAASQYQMEGGGTASFSPGIPTSPTDTTTVSSMNFGSFPILGTGILQNTQVAGAYNCDERTSTSLGSSRVVGGAANFKLTFLWKCVRSPGQAVTGPAQIWGFFSNDPAVISGVTPGRPFFRGVFDSTGPGDVPNNADGGGDSVAMQCGGGFAPVNPFAAPAAATMLTGKITEATFGGECTAIA